MTNLTALIHASQAASAHRRWMSHDGRITAYRVALSRIVCLLACQAETRGRAIRASRTRSQRAWLAIKWHWSLGWGYRIAVGLPACLWTAGAIAWLFGLRMSETHFIFYWTQ